MKIVVCTPFMGALDPEHDAAVQKLQEMCRERNIGLCAVRPQGCSAVDQARAMTAASALEETQADVLLWVDSDIIFDPEDAIAICQEAHAARDIVGGAYAVKRPCGGRMAVSFFPGTKTPIRFFEGGSFIPVRGMGFGFIAIDRRVYDKMAPEYPLVDLMGRKVRSWFLPEIEDGNYKSEDIAFCDRARRAGFTVWLDTTVRLYHKGVYAYSLEDMSQGVGLAQTLDVSLGDRSFEDAAAGCIFTKAWSEILQVVQPKDAGFPVDHDAARFLAEQAIGLGADAHIVEYGCGAGYSCAMLGLGGARVESFDNSPLWLERAGENLKQLRTDYMLVRFDESMHPLPQKHIDLLFIDAEDSVRPRVLPTLIQTGCLDKSSKIFVHDAFRPHERAMLDRWAQELGCTWELALKLGRGVAQVQL